MDIDLPEMKGTEATRLIRCFEKKFENIHSIIIVVANQGCDSN